MAELEGKGLPAGACCNKILTLAENYRCCELIIRGIII
jgi:hypothetical protein